jgi:hypothetical protein
MAPKPPTNEFAQCSTCINFIAARKRCKLFSARDVVQPTATCGLYAHGKPTDDEPLSSTTPKEAGYVDAAVRCENCSWFDGECGLYKLLNKQGDTFALDPDVNAKGCCNGWQP